MSLFLMILQDNLYPMLDSESVDVRHPAPIDVLKASNTLSSEVSL
jgi:hypothetical protein